MHYKRLMVSWCYQVATCKASGVVGQLSLSAVPFMEGATDCVELGIFSSLQPQNIRLVRAVVREKSTELKGARYSLLFDPQTAGGLLVSLPAKKAAAYVKDLHAAGYKDAAVVGKVEAARGGGEGPECVRILD